MKSLLHKLTGFICALFRRKTVKRWPDGTPYTEGDKFADRADYE